MAAQGEREQLAAELHDSLAQTLSFLNFKLDRLEELSAAGASTAIMHELTQMRAATTKAFHQVRNALTGLRAQPPEGGALAAQLAACVDEIRYSGLPAELSIGDARALALPAVAQQQVTQIVREALTNVWRHAEAERATVTVTCESNIARFVIQDNGRGFDPTGVNSHTHLGLAIMHARAERSGGGLVVHSQPGQGTRVIVSFEQASGAQ
jgi:two-component system nitrate/nitrite sensor histidine kinase NarX